MTRSTDRLLADAIRSTDPTTRSTLLVAAAVALDAEGLTQKAAACRRLAQEEAAAAR